EAGRLVKDRFPIRAQTGTIIVNPAARVAENLNVRIAKGSEITFGLVVLAPQSGMERPENDIKRAQRRGLHVAFAQGIEIQFDGTQNGQILSTYAQFGIDSFDLSRLFLQLCFINSVRDR